MRQLTGVSQLEEWVLWMHAKRNRTSVINERTRILIQFASEQNVQPATASAIDIVNWLAQHEFDWSDGTACTYFGYLRAWYKWLQITDRRMDDPMLKVGTPKSPDREPRPVSDAALMKLLTTSMRHRTRVMILLMALAGLRVSEVARVRGQDVDVTVPSIWVDGKNRKARTVPLHPLLIDAAATMPSHGVWFPANSTRPGESVLGKSVSHTVSLTMRRADIAGTPHKLRHWYGTVLLEEGNNLRVVQKLLRHSSLQSTQIYTKIPDTQLHEAINTLDPFRAGRKAA